MTTHDDNAQKRPDPDATPESADYDAMAKQMLDDWQNRWKTTQLPEQLQQVQDVMQIQWQQMIQPALAMSQNFWQQMMNPTAAPEAPAAPAEQHQQTQQPQQARSGEPDEQPSFYAAAPTATGNDGAGHDEHDAAADDAGVAEPVSPAGVSTSSTTDMPELAPLASPIAAAFAASVDLRKAMDRNDGAAVQSAGQPTGQQTGQSASQATNQPVIGPNLAAELARRMDGLSARILRLESELERLRKLFQAQ